MTKPFLAIISVVIITKDSEKTLPATLKSVESFGEVILYDTGKDKTRAVAKHFSNVRYVKGNFIGFGETKKKACAYTSNDWILSLDSDEVLSKEAAREIQETPLNTQSVYSFPFHNFYKGKWIKGCGWYPDRHVRLFAKTHTHFDNAPLHEGICLQKMQHVRMRSPIYHYSYNDISDFLRKMQAYSTLFAQAYVGKKKSSFWHAILHSGFAFFKAYFIKRGLFDGSKGFIISLYQSQTAFYKYLKLKELNDDLNSSLP